MHSHHLNCVLLDTGSGCASPLSIDGVAFGVGAWSISRILNGPSRTNGARPLHGSSWKALRHSTSYWDGLEYESWQWHVGQDRMFRKVLGGGTERKETVKSKQSPIPYEAWS